MQTLAFGYNENNIFQYFSCYCHCCQASVPENLDTVPYRYIYICHSFSVELLISGLLMIAVASSLFTGIMGHTQSLAL